LRTGIIAIIIKTQENLKRAHELNDALIKIEGTCGPIDRQSNLGAKRRLIQRLFDV
jgi:hypothetical protein